MAEPMKLKILVLCVKWTIMLYSQKHMINISDQFNLPFSVYFVPITANRSYACRSRVEYTRPQNG